MFDSELSADLEWIQQGIDAILALPLFRQWQLRDELAYLRLLKQELEARRD